MQIVIDQAYTSLNSVKWIHKAESRPEVRRRLESFREKWTHLSVLHPNRTEVGHRVQTGPGSLTQLLRLLHGSASSSSVLFSAQFKQPVWNALHLLPGFFFIYSGNLIKLWIIACFLSHFSLHFSVPLSDLPPPVSSQVCLIYHLPLPSFATPLGKKKECHLLAGVAGKKVQHKYSNVLSFCSMMHQNESIFIFNGLWFCLQFGKVIPNTQRCLNAFTALIVWCRCLYLFPRARRSVVSV